MRDIDWFIGLDGSEDLRDLSSGTRHDLLLSNGFAVGAMLRHPETPANFFDGAICEMVLLSTTLSEVDRRKLEGYLVHKWGMVANLPLSHPYKADAPQFSGAVASLNGTASDAEGDVLTHEWSLVSGPVSVVFANPLAPQTTAIFTTEGLYTLRLTTTDGLGTRYDDCLVAVGDVTLPTPFEVWAGEDGVTLRR